MSIGQSEIGSSLKDKVISNAYRSAPDSIAVFFTDGTGMTFRAVDSGIAATISTDPGTRSWDYPHGRNLDMPEGSDTTPLTDLQLALSRAVDFANALPAGNAQVEYAELVGVYLTQIAAAVKVAMP